MDRNGVSEERLAELYRQFGSLVRRRCLQVTGDAAMADDAVQETFVRVWRYGRALEQAESRLGWLYRVAERCCFDAMSRRARRPEEPLDCSGAAALAVPALTPHDDRQVVLRFLRRFDDKLKQVAVLHYLDELTQDEIARATGWSRQTVNKKIALLRQRAEALRAQLLGETEST